MKNKLLSDSDKHSSLSWKQLIINGRFQAQGLSISSVPAAKKEAEPSAAADPS